MISRLVQNRIAAALFACLVTVTAITVIWTMRQGWGCTSSAAVSATPCSMPRTGARVPHGRAAARRRTGPDCSRSAERRDRGRRPSFYGHPGIDPIGVGRALYRDVRYGKLEGGSTLTQQLARTLFLSNKKTPLRKAQEAVLALLLEQELSKSQILEFYLNRIYLSAGVYGVETMSRNLYGKPASSVTLPEAALMAGLIRAPSALSPCRISTARSSEAASC